MQQAANVLQHPKARGIDVTSGSNEIDLVKEVVYSRRDYMSETRNTLVITRLPVLAVRLLDMTARKIENSCGSHPGQSVVATVALTNGVEQLKRDIGILRILDLRAQLDKLESQQNVDIHAIDEADSMIGRWEVFGDMSRGGQRLQLNYVTRDTAAAIERIIGALGLYKGVFSTLAIYKCLSSQRYLTAARINQIKSELYKFNIRLKWRARGVDAIVRDLHNAR